MLAATLGLPSVSALAIDRPTSSAAAPAADHGAAGSSATAVATSRPSVVRGYDQPAHSSRSRTSSTGLVRATKVVPEIKAGASGGATAGKAFPQSVRKEALDENPSTCVFCRMGRTRRRSTMRFRGRGAVTRRLRTRRHRVLTATPRRARGIVRSIRRRGIAARGRRRGGHDGGRTCRCGPRRAGLA